MTISECTRLAADSPTQKWASQPTQDKINNVKNTGTTMCECVVSKVPHHCY